MRLLYFIKKWKTGINIDELFNREYLLISKLSLYIDILSNGLVEYSKSSKYIDKSNNSINILKYGHIISFTNVFPIKLPIYHYLPSLYKKSHTNNFLPSFPFLSLFFQTIKIITFHSIHDKKMHNNIPWYKPEH